MNDTDLPEGLYERVLTEQLRTRLAALDPGLEAKWRKLDDQAASVALANHLGRVMARMLRGDPQRQATLINDVLDLLSNDHHRAVDGERLEMPPSELASIVRRRPPAEPKAPARPRTRLSESALLTNASGDESMGTALAAELASADRVDLLCAFIRWPGLRIVVDQLTELVERAETDLPALRVVTTTYMAGTQRQALDRLAAIGAEIKVAYESKRTRLHAKAWLFHRHSGFSTAYIGSSNLSRAAMLDGVEWNVRLSQMESPHLLDKFRATFESYWESREFEGYRPERDAERFDLAVKNEKGGTPATAISPIAVRPYVYQREMLERLETERTVHGSSRNLVVAATGTGKTVLAALDYRQLARDESRSCQTLLFVAHRREILDQSLRTFRQVTGDGTFGELLVAGARPDRWKHVFASIQSLSLIQELPEDSFDVVIIDEFHHAGAATYERLLNRLKPKVLLGLTATPERADGLDILRWFDHRMAVELRLWDALDQQLLCPFQYFGVSDNTDLRGLTWRSGGYVIEELQKLYTGDDARVALVLKALRDKVVDVKEMRALGFCVSRDHARFMASRFNRAGIPAAAVLGTTDHAERDEALRKLRRRELNILFAVDIYNEGVDVPDVDTLLMLRPSHSATLFMQQLGRGLRLADDKSCCTVLDFIGQHQRRFRFDLRYRALTGNSRKGVIEGISHGFPHLPAGCHIQLDRVARKIVLRNIADSLPANRNQFVAELKALGPKTTLAGFLREVMVEPEELYARGRSFTQLRRLAGFDAQPALDDSELLRRLETMLHVDDSERFSFLSELLRNEMPPQMRELSERDRRRLTMLHFCLRGHVRQWRNLEASIADIWRHPAVRRELISLMAVMAGRRTHRTHGLAMHGHIPLRVHARYTRDEIRAAVGDLVAERPSSHQTGVHWSKANEMDVFFVTLNKSAAHFSPSTRYRDYPISETLFHWESQSNTSVSSPTGQRYLGQVAGGTKVLLCVREVGKDARGVAMPFLCLGLADYLRHEGSRPIAITWRLRRAMPVEWFERAKAVAG